MRAVVFNSAGEPHIAELPPPEGNGELAKVLACALCGSDVEKIGRVPPGTVLGHEVVAQLEDGRRMALVHHQPCGECERCKAGRESTCEQFPTATIVPGGFTEVVRASSGIEIPEGVDDVYGTFAEPLACVLRAVDGIPTGRILVVGCGFIGLLFVQVLLRRGGEVIVVDPVEERVKLAVQLGASTEKGPVTGAVLCSHGGLNEALASLDPGGTVIVFAAPDGWVPIDLDSIYRKELAIQGYRSATPWHMRQAVSMLADLDPLPVTVLPLEEFERGLKLYRKRKALKVVFRP